jgi:hypothetical protein
VETTSRIIVVDEVAYPVKFRGFDATLDAAGPDGETVHLRPWTYRDHMDALRLSLRPTVRGLELDTENFCRCVLERSGLPEDYDSDLGGLVLWWAGGGEPEAATLAGDGWFDLGPVRVQLRGWSSAQRIRALARSLIEDESGESFDAVSYLDAMVRASIKASDPETDLEQLASDATATLLEAVINLNAPEQLLPEAAISRETGTVREHARTTLRLCASLGWTPSRVWATPAAEVDRLLALIDLTHPETSVQWVRPSSLAAYPDSVVIYFEDEGLEDD